MSVGAHDFAIPHDLVSPTRDMVIVHIPRAPKRIGSLLVPDISRDLAQHNTMAGIIVSMGELAFAEKHDDGVKKVRVYMNAEKTMWRDPQVGDWAVFRPFAGTMITGGQLMASFGYRYMSSFQDIIGVLPPEFMPPKASLLWTDDEDAQPAPEVLPDITGVRERVVYSREG